MQTAGGEQREPERDHDQQPEQALIQEPDEPATRPGGVRGWYERMVGDRSLQVYAILMAGVGVLAVLLLIIYLTGRDTGSGQDAPVCLDIDHQEARRVIANGELARMTVLTEQDRPDLGPIAVSLGLNDQSCRELPQGIGGQADLNEIIGMVTVYNEVMAGEQRVQINWRAQSNIPAALLSSPTPTPTVTPLPTATVPVTETPVPLTETTVPATGTPAPATATTRPATATPAPPRPTRIPALPTTLPVAAASPVAVTPTPAPIVDPAGSPAPAIASPATVP